MIKLLIVLLSFSCIFSVGAEELRSKKIRTTLCENMKLQVELLHGFNFEIAAESKKDKDIEIVQNFDERCANSKSSFIITDKVFNEKAQRTSEISIDIKLEFENELIMQSKAVIRRELFDPDSGEIKIGKWYNPKLSVDYAFLSDAVDQIAKGIVYLSDFHNGDGEVSKYEVTDFSVDHRINELNKELEEQGDEYSCKMSRYSKDTSELWTMAIKGGSPDKRPFNYINLLHRMGYMTQVIGNSTTDEDYSESCNHINIEVYLNNGTYLILNYDFTT